MNNHDRMTEVLLANSQTPAGQMSPYAKPGASGFNTQLDPLNEMAFRQWVARNKVPFNPDKEMTDYDMRGFYQGLQQQNPRAISSINPNDQQLHYPDWWKTPTGMDRLVQHNVLAMSGRAVEAAGDVSTLLLDKTGTITYGNPGPLRLIPGPVVDPSLTLAAAARAGQPGRRNPGR